MIIATYQAASGAGAAAMDELVESTRAYLDGQAFHAARCCRTPMPSTCSATTPTIDPETGYNDEETKIIKETRKIFEDEKIARRRHLRARAGAARPLRGHHLRMRAADQRGRGARASWPAAPGVKIVDDRAKNYFPMPIDASGQDDVLVGRIRQDLSDPSGPFDLDVRRRRPAAEGRGAERGADRGALAATRDGIGIVGRVSET